MLDEAREAPYAVARQLIVPAIQLGAIVLAVLVDNSLPGLKAFRAAFYLPVVTSVSGGRLQGIPKDLDEAARLDAARVDGASELYIFLRIMLPLALPQIGALTILTTVTTWNNFLWPSVVLTKSDLMPLVVGILELSGTFGSSTRVIAAAAVLTIAPALIVFFFTQRFFMRGMEGAIK